MLKNIRVLSYLFSSHSLETVFARVRISNDPEFRFPQKLWCLLYKSPSEIQDISLKWSIHFFSPTPFLLKWPFLVQMIVRNLTIIGILTDRQYIDRMDRESFSRSPIFIMIVRAYHDRDGIFWSKGLNEFMLTIIKIIISTYLQIRSRSFWWSKFLFKGDSGGSISCIVNDVALSFGVVSWGIGCGDANKPG